jgi:hypothetical protein
MTRDDLGDEIYGLIVDAVGVQDDFPASDIERILKLVDVYATEQCVKAIGAGEVTLESGTP